MILARQDCHLCRTKWPETDVDISFESEATQRSERMLERIKRPVKEIRDFQEVSKLTVQDLCIHIFKHD